MNIYQQELMDHYRNPRHHGTLEQPTFDSVEHNPLCGDTVRVQGVIEEGRLTTIAFTGQGCVISQALASITCAFVCGRSVEEILVLDASAIVSLTGMQFGPNRLKCVMLALHALQKGIKIAG